MRARLDPAQRWMPTPKAMWRLACAVDDHLVGVGEGSGSRLAAGKFMSTRSPGWNVTPTASTSSCTTRAMVTGE